MEELQRILFLVMAGLGVAIFFSRIFQRFKSDEMIDKRQLDWQIIALENGLVPIEPPKEFDRFLLARSLRYDPVFGTVSNAFSFDDKDPKTYVFDFHQFRSVENAHGSISKIELNYQAVCVEFQNRDFPDFHLSKRDDFWVSGYIDIRSHIYPDWIPEPIQIASSGNEAKDIMYLLKSNRVLNKMVNHKNFAALLFRGSSVALYFDKQLPVDENSLQQLKRWAQKLSDIADPQRLVPDPEIEVKLLKKDNKNRGDQKGA